MERIIIDMDEVMADVPWGQCLNKYKNYTQPLDYSKMKGSWMLEFLKIAKPLPEPLYSEVFSSSSCDGRLRGCNG